MSNSILLSICCFTTYYSNVYGYSNSNISFNNISSNISLPFTTHHVDLSSTTIITTNYPLSTTQSDSVSSFTDKYLLWWIVGLLACGLFCTCCVLLFYMKMSVNYSKNAIKQQIRVQNERREKKLSNNSNSNSNSLNAISVTQINRKNSSIIKLKKGSNNSPISSIHSPISMQSISTKSTKSTKSSSKSKKSKKSKKVKTLPNSKNPKKSGKIRKNKHHKIEFDNDNDADDDEDNDDIMSIGQSTTIEMRTNIIYKQPMSVGSNSSSISPLQIDNDAEWDVDNQLKMNKLYEYNQYSTEFDKKHQNIDRNNIDVRFAMGHVQNINDNNILLNDHVINNKLRIKRISQESLPLTSTTYILNNDTNQSNNDHDNNVDENSYKL